MNNELCIQKKMYLLFVKINFALTISTSIHSPLVQTQATNGILYCVSLGASGTKYFYHKENSKMDIQQKVKLVFHLFKFIITIILTVVSILISKEVWEQYQTKATSFK